MTEFGIINIRVVEYLFEIEVERWAHCKFSVTQYNTMTTNIDKCMNAIMRDAKEMSLVSLLKIYAQSYNNGSMIVEPLSVT